MKKIKFNKALGYGDKGFKADEVIDTDDKCLISVAEDTENDICEIVGSKASKSSTKSSAKKKKEVT